MMTVYPYIAFFINAVKININYFTLRRSRNSKGFTIPANTAWERAAFWSGGVFFFKFTFNAPIMWQAQFAPLGII